MAQTASIDYFVRQLAVDVTRSVECRVVAVLAHRLRRRRRCRCGRRRCWCRRRRRRGGGVRHRR